MVGGPGHGRPMGSPFGGTESGALFRLIYGATFRFVNGRRETGAGIRRAAAAWRIECLHKMMYVMKTR